MLYSMTGYGQASYQSDELDLTVTLRTVNSKNLDINIQLPELFADEESALKRLFAEKLQRGRVHCQVKYKNTSELVVPPLDADKVEQYFQDLKAVADKLGVKADTQLLEIALAMPDVRQSEEEEDEARKALYEARWPILKEKIEEALAACLAFREQEGEALFRKIDGYIRRIADLRTQALAVEKERMPHIREKIRRHIQGFTEESHFDPARFEQELVYYSERLDVTEELDRLETHLRHFGDTAAAPADKPKGKRLNFIAQEIGREINTLGAKANYAPLQHLVIEMKEELDKIKEQILNIV